MKNNPLPGTRCPPVLALAKKELYSFSNYPVTYGIGIFFLLFCSIWLFFFQHFFTLDTVSLRSWFAAFPLAFILVIPCITMKSWAEERRIGSIELLLTMPFSEWDLVLGKFIASAGVLLFILILSIPLPLSLMSLGALDAGVILCEYLGALLLGCSAISLGLFLSSLAGNQAGAFLGSAVILLAVMLINRVTLVFDLPPGLAAVCNWLSLSFHFESFSRGLVDTRDLAFFILTAFLFLFLNTRVLIYRKWR